MSDEFVEIERRVHIPLVDFGVRQAENFTNNPSLLDELFDKLDI